MRPCRMLLSMVDIGQHLAPVTRIKAAPIEFVSALRRQGEVRLRRLDIENVRVEVYRAARLDSAFPLSDAAGRYQPVKIAIEPVNVSASSVPIISSMIIEAMPVGL